MLRTSIALAATLLLALGSSAAEVITLNPAVDVLSTEVLESSSTGTVIRYDIGSIVTEAVSIDGGTYHSIALGGESRSLEKGLPALPTIARSIIVPDDREMAVRVVSSRYVDFEGIDVVPSKGAIPRTVDPATVAYTFDPFYQTDGWYPSTLAQGREPYIMRDVRGMVVVVNPVQYNPATRTLRVYDHVVVAVEPVGPGRINVLNGRPNTGLNHEFRKIYERHFLNYGSAVGLRYTPVEEAGNMLVIAYGSFMTAMEPYVEWKKQMGIPCEMVSVTEAGGSSAGIQSYIQTYYDTNGLTYVLLVGDAAQVPSLSAHGGASDPSYSLVAGSDTYPDLFVGRFSAEAVNQVETQVERSIEYEKTPQAGADWYHKGTGIASNQGPGDDGEYDDEHSDNMRADLLAFTYTEVDQIYDPSASATMVSNALNAGRSIVNYTGHGSTMGWGSSGFTSSDVNALTNDNMLPFIWSVACVNGQFNGITCFAEVWMRATNGGEPSGAIATYMSSINQDWDEPMDAQDEMVDLLVGTSAYGIKRTFGGLSYNGSCHMLDEYGLDGEDDFLTWHIFGDPSLRVRTDTPAMLDVVHDDTIEPSDTSFDVTVVGVEGALCALYKDGVLYGSAFTGASGTASIAIGVPLPNDEDLTLTVTAFNAIPYFGTVHVGVAYTPIIFVAPAFFDAEMEPDQTRTDTLTIENVGEPLSILHYDIEIVDAGMSRNVNGSEMTAAPTTYEPGTSSSYTLSVYNGSPDDEWINAATLDFPVGVTVLTASGLQISDRVLAWDGTAGDGANVGWNGDWWNVVYPGETAVSTVSLAIDSGFEGNVEAVYGLQGDGYGSPPHSVSGTVVLEGPTGPTLTLTSPNGGEVWAVGESHDIIWDRTGAPLDVTIHCSSDAGGSWDTLIDGAPNDGVHPWIVDSPASDDCLMKVSLTSDPSTYDISDGSFSVYQPVDWLTVQPTSGDVPVGSRSAVEVTYDTAGMEDGDYYADIVITSNGGDPVVVPVALHVSSTGVDDRVPGTVVLYGSYPNPFAPSSGIGVAHVAFSVPSETHVTVTVYTPGGRLVRTLADRPFAHGRHTVPWDGKDASGQTVSSGVYFYRVEADGASLGGKMVLMP